MERVAPIGDTGNSCRISWENLIGANHLEDLGIDGRILEGVNCIHLAQFMLLVTVSC